MKKVKYNNVDGVKMPYFEYQKLPTDGKRRRLQKGFLKQFSKCGLYEPSCKHLKVSATSIKRWYEIDDWFTKELEEAFEFAVTHYYEDLETVPLNRRHNLFNLHRVKYEGREVYDNSLEQITIDECIDENGDKQLTENAKALIRYEEAQREPEQVIEFEARKDAQKEQSEKDIEEMRSATRSGHDYVEGDMGMEEYIRIKEMDKDKESAMA